MVEHILYNSFLTSDQNKLGDLHLKQNRPIAVNTTRTTAGELKIMRFFLFFCLSYIFSLLVPLSLYFIVNCFSSSFPLNLIITDWAAECRERDHLQTNFSLPPRLRFLNLTCWGSLCRRLYLIDGNIWSHIPCRQSFFWTVVENCHEFALDWRSEDNPQRLNVAMAVWNPGVSKITTQYLFSCLRFKVPNVKIAFRISFACSRLRRLLLLNFTLQTWFGFFVRTREHEQLGGPYSKVNPWKSQELIPVPNSINEIYTGRQADRLKTHYQCALRKRVRGVGNINRGRTGYLTLNITWEGLPWAIRDYQRLRVLAFILCWLFFSSDKAQLHASQQIYKHTRYPKYGISGLITLYF